MKNQIHFTRIRLLQPRYVAAVLALSFALPFTASAASVEERLAALEKLVGDQAAEIAMLRRELNARPAATPASTSVADTTPPPAPTPAKPAAVAVNPAAKAVQKLNLGGRLQIQFAALDTDIDGAADPAATNHFFIRRAYLTTKPVFNETWNANITYDLAGSFFDNAYLQNKNRAGTLDLGLRKVSFGNEEKLSSGSLKAIERSGVTRYFVEPANGRRLGAGSYRLGAFFDGKSDNVVYGLAVTNPERVGDSTSSGTSANNSLAVWGNAGVNLKLDQGSASVGAGFGFLPDQGGSTPGTGRDLLVGSLYTDTTIGHLNLLAEVLFADADGAQPWGFYVQPALMLTDTIEGVARFSYLDTDGRGVNLSDGVRSAPGGGTMDRLYEGYLGANWYILGNDLKFQAGLVYGRSEDTVSGSPARAETFGMRSMLQLQY